MTVRDYSQLLQQLDAEYAAHAPRSAALQKRATDVLIDGGNHLVRLNKPVPTRYVEARGAYIHDADGHVVLDYWQGHFANILGHNPPEVTQTLAEALERGWGLQAGFTDELLSSEADRCFSCGVCNYCDNCWIYCPDVAIARHEDEYEFLYDYCKGCLVCAFECPRNAISIREEGK